MMSLKISAKGNVGELIALFNLLSASDQVTFIKSNPLYRNKDVDTGSLNSEFFRLTEDDVLYIRSL